MLSRWKINLIFIILLTEVVKMLYPEVQANMLMRITFLYNIREGEKEGRATRALTPGFLLPLTTTHLEALMLELLSKQRGLQFGLFTPFCTI